MTSTPADSQRDFGTIGVIGLGTMGAGIAEVFARNGFTVVGVELNDEGVERGRQHLEHSTGRAVKRGEDDRGGAAGAAGPDLVHHLDQGPRGRRLRGRGGRGVAGDQEGDLPPARRHRRAGVDPGHQHLVAVGHRDLHRQQPARAGSSASTSSTPRRSRTWSRSSARSSPSRRSSTTSRRWSTRSARTPWSAATRRASSPTRCCSATSTTRSRCTSTATPPARTSTPRCGSAAATRWARSRCST